MAYRTQNSDIELFAREFKQIINEGNSTYGLTALGDEVDRLLQAPEGSRNDQLNKSAYALGQLVAGQELDRPYVESKLEDIAIQIGLSPSETNATIQSGLDAGMKYPRSATNESINGEPPFQIGTNRPHQIPSYGWIPYTLEDTLGDLPPVEYVVERLFERPSLNIIYAPPGAFKSFLMQDLSVCVAAGIPWLTPESEDHKLSAFITNKCPVIWLDFDQGHRNTIRRFSALREGHKAPANIPLIFYTMPIPPLDPTDPGSMDHLQSLVSGQKAKLIVIDTLKAISGRVEENSGDMANLMFAFRQLAENTGAAIFLLHHQRKNSGFGGRVGDSLRGHSSIEAALDSAWLIKRNKNSEVFTMEATKTRGRSHDPIRIGFSWVNDGDGEICSARFFCLDPNSSSDYDEIDGSIKEILDNGELNQKGVIEEVRKKVSGASINLVRARIRALSERGDIVVCRGDRKEKLFNLREKFDES